MPKLAIQTGHSQPITDLQFSPGNNLLASCSSDGSIILWDIFTGKQLCAINKHRTTVNSIAFHTIKKIMASGNESGELVICDYPSGNNSKTFLLMNVIRKVVFSVDGKSLIAIGDKVCFINLESFEIAYFNLQPKYQFDCCALSNDGELLALGGVKENKTLVIKLSNKAILFQLNGKSKSLSFNPIGNALFAAGINGKLLKWDLEGKKTKPKFTIPSNRIWQYYTSVIANQNIFAGANKNGFLYLHRISNGKIIATLSNHYSEVTTLAIAGGDQMIASADRDHSITIWDLNKLELLKQLKGNAGKISAMSFDPDGKGLLIGYIGGNTTKFYLDDFSKTINYRFKKNLKDKILARNYTVERIEQSKTNPALQQVILLKYKLDKKHNDKLKKQRLFYFDWNINTNKTGKKRRLNPLYYKRTDVMDQKGNYIVRADTINQINIHNLISKQTHKVPSGHAEKVNSICINPKFNLVATASLDGFIKFFQLNEPKLIFSIALFDDNNYIFLDSASNYLASKGAYQYIGFALHEKYLFLDQFDIIFNKPHEVLSKAELYPSELITAYKNAYQRRVQYSAVKTILNESESKIPQLTIINKKEIPLKTNDETASIQLEINCKACEINRYQLLINGVPLQDAKGFKTDGKSKFFLNVPLSDGINKIDAFCISTEGIESYKDVITITKIKSKKSLKPTLHFIPISVSDYKDQNYSLKYAAKDGRDLTSIFSSKKSDYIINVSDSFINQSATREEILKVKQKLLQTGVNDMVILFLSGHGLLDTSYNFWFATHDINFKKPAERGLSFEEIEWLMDSIPARKKLILMDACHSGEFDKNAIAGSSLIVKETKAGKVSASGTKGSELLQDSSSLSLSNTFELMQQLFSNFNNGSGTQVISAAAGNSYAFESETWNNGVFTFSIIQGLKNRKSDLNKNGKVSVSELTKYVSKEVQQLTNGAQKPTSRKENQDNDWNIW